MPSPTTVSAAELTNRGGASARLAATDTAQRAGSVRAGDRHATAWAAGAIAAFVQARAGRSFPFG